jgi:hypothetical protein
MIRVSIELAETSLKIERAAVNAYIKGPFYCVYDGSKVEKYPLANIWRVTEDYSVATASERAAGAKSPQPEGEGTP